MISCTELPIYSGHFIRRIHGFTETPLYVFSVFFRIFIKLYHRAANSFDNTFCLVCPDSRRMPSRECISMNHLSRHEFCEHGGPFAIEVDYLISPVFDLTFSSINEA